MEDKLNLYQKLLKIQKAVIGLAKDKQAFGYKYVTGDKLLAEIKPIMNESGILLKQEILSIENTRQDYATNAGKEKSEILSKVMMRFTWVDAESGEKDENLFGANGQNDFDKGVGSALTYAERYFILKYFHIATDEDDIDNPDRKSHENKPAKTTAESNPAALTKPAAELKWLNQNTDQWTEAVKYLKMDGKIEAIEKKYKLSKENRAALLQTAAQPA